MKSIHVLPAFYAMVEKCLMEQSQDAPVSFLWTKSVHGERLHGCLQKIFQFPIDFLFKG